MRKKRRPPQASRRVSWRILLALLLFAFVQGTLANPPRVSFVEGEAIYEPADEVEITQLALNLPLVTGDRIYLTESTRIEIQQGPGNLVQASSHTDLKWLGTDDVLRIELTSGDLILRITDDERHKVFTPLASVRINGPGIYRLRVNPEGALVVAVRDGSAEVANRFRVREISAGGADRGRSGPVGVDASLRMANAGRL